MTKAAQQWTEQEFAGLDLGDARLNKRAKRMKERFSANPTASIPEAETEIPSLRPDKKYPAAPPATSPATAP